MKSHKHFLLIPVVLILSVKVFGQAAVDIPFSVTDGTSTANLSIGLDLSATTCIDSALGEYIFNVMPPAGVFDSRLDLAPYGCGEVLFTLKDYRSPGDPPAFPFTGMIEQTLAFQTSSLGLPINITINLPFGVILTITDPINGSILNIGPFTGQVIATIPGTYTQWFSRALLKMEYNNIIPGTTTQSSVSINNGWNILSVPLVASDMNGTTIFPTSISPFYAYNSGYNQVTTLENGIGYWAEFNSDQTVTITGNYVPVTEISVNQGWNLIGPFAYNVVVSGITTVPPNIASSLFYGYEGGYIIPTTLLPGKGYWIKANQNGVIQLNASLGK
ncbi:MAG: hypothetical protein OEM46_00355 [Ignavibacteria bacterium]|nr:hypothetical protein [Ignavibacteria bacterium]